MTKDNGERMTEAEIRSLVTDSIKEGIRDAEYSPMLQTLAKAFKPGKGESKDKTEDWKERFHALADVRDEAHERLANALAINPLVGWGFMDVVEEAVKRLHEASGKDLQDHLRSKTGPDGKQWVKAGPQMELVADLTTAAHQAEKALLVKEKQIVDLTNANERLGVQLAESQEARKKADDLSAKLQRDISYSITTLRGALPAERAFFAHDLEGAILASAGAIESLRDRLHESQDWGKYLKARLDAVAQERDKAQEFIAEIDSELRDAFNIHEEVEPDAVLGEVRKWVKEQGGGTISEAMQVRIRELEATCKDWKTAYETLRKAQSNTKADRDNLQRFNAKAVKLEAKLRKKLAKAQTYNANLHTELDGLQVEQLTRERDAARAEVHCERTAREKLEAALTAAENDLEVRK